MDICSESHDCKMQYGAGLANGLKVAAIRNIGGAPDYAPFSPTPVRIRRAARGHPPGPGGSLMQVIPSDRMSRNPVYPTEPGKNGTFDERLKLC